MSVSLLSPAKPKLLSRRKLVTDGAATVTLFNIIQSRPAEAQSPCGTFYPTVPAEAAAAGFTKLVFRDDFTVPGTIDPTGNATAGYNWYLRPGIGVTSADTVVSAGLSAAGVSNGNSGGGSFASPLGGILALNCPVAGGNGNTTIISTPPSSIKSYNPGFGCWNHGYFEFYAQMNPNVTANNQWWALWFFSQLITSGTHTTEIDLMESYSGNFGYTGGSQDYMTTGGHQWSSTGGNQVAAGGGGIVSNAPGNPALLLDLNWHLYGMLWVSTGSNTGYFQIFIDRVPVYAYNGGNPVTKIASGTGGISGYQWAEEGGLLYIQLGCPGRAAVGGSGILYLDYINVWQ
jgi:hypothetical protein